jgi:hypothetical protein
MKSILAALFALTLFATARDKTLDIYWIDSEGGGSTLIVTPAGESVLIDTGNPGGRDAPRIHKVATEQAKLTRIDHVIFMRTTSADWRNWRHSCPLARCMTKASPRAARMAKARMYGGLC